MIVLSAWIDGLTIWRLDWILFSIKNTVEGLDGEFESQGDKIEAESKHEPIENDNAVYVVIITLLEHF